MKLIMSIMQDMGALITQKCVKESKHGKQVRQLNVIQRSLKAIAEQKAADLYCRTSMFRPVRTPPSSAPVLSRSLAQPSYLLAFFWPRELPPHQSSRLSI